MLTANSQNLSDVTSGELLLMANSPKFGFQYNSDG